MSRKKNRKNKKNNISKNSFSLPSEVKQWIWAVLLILIAILIALSFFKKAGIAGEVFTKYLYILVGGTAFVAPLIFILAGFVFIKTAREEKGKNEIIKPAVLAIILAISGLSGIMGIFNPEIRKGGWLGYILSWPFLKYFGFWASVFIFLAPVVISGFIFWHYLGSVKAPKEEKEEFGDLEEKQEEIEETPRISIIKKIFAPKFKVREISPNISEEKQIEKQAAPVAKAEIKPVPGLKIAYNSPPIDLLEKDHGAPTSGDIKVNSAIIKKTLQNFGIDVSMAEVNIGPTVTQYTLKPAEGIKLSKITGLNNDLSLALASHPIRIEAPVPGRALVGIEIPNKVRAQVRLRNLIDNPAFQKSSANLLLPLGKDVSGFPVYTDLTKMPHMLVAGSTGTGKTIFLNSLIMSLLYQPATFTKSSAPQNLRLILVDPKRVEFPVYSNLPHLLCPVIYNATQTVNALRWLTGEMERRFDVLAQARSRDIGGFNEKALKDGTEPLPFIVVIIDELADLMMAKGREIEAGIVRLAQMARAVGIHLVVATQRPSVEVITGLIKANITCRVTFQVASQVDSRTVLDCSGAEKLLGAGDLLYISAQVTKPKRVQGAYISEKEVRKVVSYIEENNKGSETESEMDEGLIKELERGGEDSEGGVASFYNGGGDKSSDDSLYEEAKKVVIEAKKASASLLQRRLRLGYARAARLIDMLEERGVIGPGEGAKPREIYGDASDKSSFNISAASIVNTNINANNEDKKTEDGWEKI